MRLDLASSNVWRRVPIPRWASSLSMRVRFISLVFLCRCLREVGLDFACSSLLLFDVDDCDASAWFVLAF